MTYIPPNQNGQAPSANSAPVVIASDQPSLTVDERHLMLLGRIAKALEGNSTIDSAQRQRITLDSITGALTLATVTTVGAVTGITNALPAGTNTIGNVTLAGMTGDEYYINIARGTYATAIRAKILP